MEEKSAHYLTLPRTYGYQPHDHIVCARQLIAHCPAMEKGTLSRQPQRTSAPAVLVVVDCATLSQGQGVAEAPGKGSTPGKSGAQCPILATNGPKQPVSWQSPRWEQKASTCRFEVPKLKVGSSRRKHIAESLGCNLKNLSSIFGPRWPTCLAEYHSAMLCQCW